MSFLNRLLGKQNSTGKWVQRLKRPLVVDFDQLALSDVRLGDRFESLSFLGPDGNPSKLIKYHDYPELGVGVGESDDGYSFDHLTVNFERNGSSPPYTGKFILNGVEVGIVKTTTPADLELLFKSWEMKTVRDDETDLVEEAAFISGQNRVEFSWDGDALWDIEIYQGN